MTRPTTIILAEYNGDSEFGPNCEHRLVERDGRTFLVIVRHGDDGPKNFAVVVPPRSVERVAKCIDNPHSPIVDGFAWTGMHWLKEHPPATEPIPVQDDYSWVVDL